MTFVELPVVPIYWHFPRTIKGYYLNMSPRPRANFSTKSKFLHQIQLFLELRDSQC